LEIVEPGKETAEIAAAYAGFGNAETYRQAEKAPLLRGSTLAGLGDILPRA
jgi:hypothetical protein